METLTQPDSILPVRSRWQHSDKLFLNTFSKSLLSCSADQNDFPPFEYLCGLFSDNSSQIWWWHSVNLYLLDLIRHHCWPATCGKCYVPLSVSTLGGRCGCSPPFTWLNSWVPHSHHSLSTCVTRCGHRWLAVSASPPTASIPQYRSGYEHKIGVWMETMAMTCYHSSDSQPQSPLHWAQLL